MVCIELRGITISPADAGDVYILESHFTLKPAAVEFLQLLPHPGHASLVDLLDDLAGLRQEETDFEPGKPVAQFDDLGLVRIELDTQDLADLPEDPHTPLQSLLAGMDQVPIVHVAAIASDPHFLLHIMVKPVRRRQSQHLADLTAKS